MHTIANVALLSYNARAFRVEGSIVCDCGEGGILVHRWSEGHNGTLVCHNQISNIAARSGGSGLNGISITDFRKGGRLAVCSNNVLRNITGTGPMRRTTRLFWGGIAAVADTCLTGNILEEARVIGINLGWGRICAI